MYACLYSAGSASAALVVVAQQFSPRYESRGDRVVVDVRGLDRLFGSAREIGDAMRRDAADRGLRVHVAIAPTQTAAIVLAISRPGVVVVEPGGEAHAIASLPIDVCGSIGVCGQIVVCGATLSGSPSGRPERPAPLEAVKRWGLRTLGDLAALPADALSARLGKPALVWHALARGQDIRPLVPDVEDERFEASLELEWPIEGLEPLSFVLTRLLEPLSLRLEQRDRGVAVLHLALRLVTKDTFARRLELPAPMRDVKTLRTLLLLDLEAQSLFTPGAPAPRTAGECVGIDRVAITIDPTPGRVLQHTLFTRPHPTPEQLSTLLARLAATMGPDRVGAPVPVDSYRPGAFAMKPFATEHDDRRAARIARGSHTSACSGGAVRRCRQPVPARVRADAGGRPMAVTSDRRGFAGGEVLQAAGPWKTSGEWWMAGWDRDEWDVALSDGARYRVFLDRADGRWFIDAILD